MTLAINFRVSGELETELLIRAAATGAGPATLVKQEWLAWRELLRASTPRLTLDEATLVMDALNGLYHGPEMAHLVWASVEDSLPELAPRYPAVDGPALVARLRGLDRVQAIALVQAVGRAWELVTGPKACDLPEALRWVGLVAKA